MLVTIIFIIKVRLL